MTTKFTSTSKNKKPSRRELRLSLLLPVVIIIVVWLIGLGVYTVTPGEVLFNQVIAILIGSSLIVTLIFYIRQAAPRLRVWALSMAVPALVGITVGVVNGRSTPILIGCGITILLLIAQRALSIPFSYRAAAQAFNRGEMNRALTLINKSIIARPDFAESYQLRALILINNLQANAAEQDAQKAISLQPQADQFYNTLGQIYLSTGRYADMRETYQNAVAINPDRAMHYYHLGLSHYRLGAYRDAAAAFSMAGATSSNACRT
ncbi:MAG: tetratricopeptide repeat protein, partial [Anaerolineae bacterium]